MAHIDSVYIVGSHCCYFQSVSTILDGYFPFITFPIMQEPYRHDIIFRKILNIGLGQ